MIEPKSASSRRQQLADYLGLERNVSAASTAVFLLTLGEELWKKFLPKYLEALGASTFTIGLFGTTIDFFDAIYQYPGGWLADRLGRRKAFLMFIALAATGYTIYLFSPTWQFIFVGLAFAMAWSSMASPAVFAVIGDALPKAQPGSRDFFLTERYVLYTEFDGDLYRARVYHEPYELYKAELTTLGSTMIQACGLPEPKTQPILHYSEQVSVDIWALESVDT